MDQTGSMTTGNHKAGQASRPEIWIFDGISFAYEFPRFAPHKIWFVHGLVQRFPADKYYNSELSLSCACDYALSTDLEGYTPRVKEIK